MTTAPNKLAYEKAYTQQRHDQRRDRWRQRMGGRCVWCGSMDRLEFDHIVVGTKGAEPSHLFRHGSDERIEAEMQKCQLLCIRCHRRKSFFERPRDSKGRLLPKEDQ